MPKWTPGTLGESLVRFVGLPLLPGEQGESLSVTRVGVLVGHLPGPVRPGLFPRQMG
jgi:hypothetical protein